MLLWLICKGFEPGNLRSRRKNGEMRMSLVPPRELLLLCLQGTVSTLIPEGYQPRVSFAGLQKLQTRQSTLSTQRLPIEGVFFSGIGVLLRSWMKQSLPFCTAYSSRCR